MAALAYVLDLEQARAPAARTGRALFRGGARGLAFGFAANLVALRFVPGVITRFTPLPWAVGALALALLALSQGLRWMAAAWVRNALVRWRVPRPLAFAAGVYAGTFVPVIFPWNPAGAAALSPELLQFADTIGERGVSALMALSAGLVASAVHAFLEARRSSSSASRRPALAMALGAAALVLTSYLHGRFRMAAVDALRARAVTAKVALVQPSVGATERWDKPRARQILASLTELTRAAERDGAELTVWHESAYPYEMRHGAAHAPETSSTVLQPGVHGPVLAGVILRGEPGANSDRFNSALVVHEGGALSAPYDKLHLLWFGETVPLADTFPWIRRTFARGLGLTPGSAQVVLPIGKVRASVLICFEDTLPAAGREALALSPNLLVNVTNDAWFSPVGSANQEANSSHSAPSAASSSAGSANGEPLRDEASLESELHLRMSILRSIEGRRDMVRAVNFGPTTWVDAAGRVRARYASTTAGILLTTPALLETPPTFYVRFGDLPFALFSLATLAGALAFGSWATKRQRRQLQAMPDADA